jgi:cytochrome c5
MPKLNQPQTLSVIALIAAFLTGSVALNGCSITEEIKQIQKVQRAHDIQERARTEDLTGEQVYMRSCNTCHSKHGPAPLLDKLSEHFPDDEGLKKFIRQGKGLMPAQPASALNDKELDNLVNYLRNLNT